MRRLRRWSVTRSCGCPVTTASARSWSVRAGSRVSRTRGLLATWGERQTPQRRSSNAGLKGRRRPQIRLRHPSMPRQQIDLRLADRAHGHLRMHVGVLAWIALEIEDLGGIPTEVVKVFVRARAHRKK